MSNLPKYAEEALEYRFVHASGPGGQHVNKTATAVELRIRLEALNLTRDIYTRLRTQQRTRINKQGELVIQADGFRSQLKNRKAALARFEEMLSKAAIRPKRRIATKPTRASQQRRISGKKIRGQTKANRKKPSFD